MATDPPPDRTLVVGLGSPHGDDRAGWLVIDRLRQQQIAAELLCLASPADLAGLATARRELIIIDACRAGRDAGTIIQGPAALAGAAIDGPAAASSHALSLADTLALLAALGRAPACVTLWGIELGTCRPLAPISRPVAEAADEIARRIASQLA
ncbi:MAG: hydrogenase maturation protease [Pirellulaceae bacterium]